MGVGLQRCHDSFCGVRIGEATHPGPTHEALDPEFPGLGDPRLGTLALGSNLDIVLRVDDDQCIALWHRERCMVKGL